jgi:hypothetical protein
VQWDLERNLYLQPLPYRSPQLGLVGESVRRYANEWTVAISDVTPLAHETHTIGRGTVSASVAPFKVPVPAAGASNRSGVPGSVL